MAKTVPNKTNGRFNSGSLDAQFLHEKGAFAFALRCDEILKMKIGVEYKTIDQPLMQRQRPARGADIVNLNEGYEAYGLAGFNELTRHFQGESATQAISAKHVGSVGLYVADLVDIPACHILKPAVD